VNRPSEAQAAYRELCFRNPDDVPYDDDSISAALERDRVVDVLDAWAAKDPGQRVWFMQPHPAGAVDCVLSDRRRERDGTDRTCYSVKQARDCDDTIEGSWQARFCNPNANNIPAFARAAAAKAIEAGKVPT
jgi:hypothetical protein